MTDCCPNGQHPTNSIAEISFFDAFGRDVDFHDLYPQAAYLDIEAGDVIWVFEEDQVSRNVWAGPDACAQGSAASLVAMKAKTVTQQKA